MFSFTVPEFAFLCACVAFVGSLILFPSFRKQLGSLVGGFLQVFVQDTAKTPEGAKAIYAQKIDEMTTKYTDACNTLRDLTGKLKTIQDKYAACQKKAKEYDERAKAAMSRGDEESATTYARMLQEELDEAENLSEQFQKIKPAAEEVKTIKEKLENQLAALKRESKDVVSELKANEQVADVYSNLDRLRASTGTDKMLNATRDGLQESREKAAGAKVLYQTSRDGKQDKADARTADYRVSSYLDGLKKSNPNVATYNIPDLNAFTKSSGLNQTQSKK